jgi:hypothetical protein
MKKLFYYFRSVLVWLDIGLNVLVLGLISLFVRHNVPAVGNPHDTCTGTLYYICQ